MTGPTVSVLIPTLNESGEIAGCLDAVAGQRYPTELIEILVVDGCSEDSTRDEVDQWAASSPIATRVLDNPARRTAVGLNVGLRHAAGDVVVRVDARARIGRDHVARCVEVLTSRPEVAVVGGGQRTLPRSTTWLDRCIARGLGNRVTTGLSRYRTSTRPGSSDTVWMGSFRRTDLVLLDGWDEGVALNEDHDLNRRFRRLGRIVWFDPHLTADYLPRRSLAAVASQYHRYGRVKGSQWASGQTPEIRQGVLVAAPVLALLLTAVLLRRWGAGKTGLVFGATGLIIDHVGSVESASAGVRLGSVAVAGTYGVSWWSGVVAGWLSPSGRRSHRREAQ